MLCHLRFEMAGQTGLGLWMEQLLQGFMPHRDRGAEIIGSVPNHQT